MADEELLAQAREARAIAYAPYSGYRVGAAVRGANGEIWAGCNVENGSYPAGICAERVALVKMVSAGQRAFTSLAVVTEDGGMPCGICLQTMLEFAPTPSAVTIILANSSEVVGHWTLAELLPHGFRLEQKGRA